MEMKEKYLVSENFNTKVYLNEGAGETALLLAGFIPVVGEIADIILIIKYIKEKRFIEAGLMMVALIPTFGDFIVKPFLDMGKAVGAFLNASKFANFLKKNKKAAEMYKKVGEGFKNPLIDRLIKQVSKILPKSGNGMNASKNLHINILGKVVQKSKKPSASNWVKQTTRQNALKRYLIKTGGVPPKNFLSSWWNVVYRARRDRKAFARKFIFGNNILASLGIFSIRDIENKMSDKKEAEKLLQDPRFKQWYDQVNNSQTSNDTEQGQSTGGNDTSALLGMIGGSSGALGLETIKKIASFLV